MPARKKPQPMPTQTTDSQSTFTFAVNGHTLDGVKRNSRWSFTCPSWPELADKYAGDEDTIGIVEEFMARALAGAVKIRKLASSQE